MQIEMTEEEWHTLRLLLRDYVPQLQREVARTDDHSFRHELVKRQEVAEHLLGILGEAEV